MEHHPTTDLLAEEIEDVLVESKMLMAELYTTKQALIKAMIGEVNYQRARDFMATQNDAKTLFEDVDEETMRQLEALDKLKCIELARDIFNLEPSSEQQSFLKDWAENIARRLYPDDTVLILLEDEEKLARVGDIVKKMSDEDDMQNNEYVSMYEDAVWEVDNKIAKIYAEITGQDGIEIIEVDETAFDIHFHDSFFEAERDKVIDDPNNDLFQSMEAIVEMSKASLFISIFDGELRIQNEAAKEKVQLEEIRAALRPIPAIIELLEKEITV